MPTLPHPTPSSCAQAQDLPVKAASPTPSSSGVSRGSLRKGFSLVELSIVLVILGLLTGGILAGQSLIRAAELRSLTAQVSQYKAATLSFRDKYLQLPGDMNNATRFWGAAHTTPATCATTQGTGTQTCDGDGNGRIETTPNVNGNTSNEMFRFWQQLANAGMIEGQYTGIQGAGSVSHAVGGQNTPATRISNLIWNIRYLGVDASYYPVFYNQNNLMVGWQGTSGWPGADGLRPEEAWSIDTKLDDGNPGTGFLGAYTSTDTGCVMVANDPSTSYNLTNTAAACGLFIAFMN